MKWFKHYSNASTSQKLNIIMDKHGLDGYAKYWLLVELLAEKFDGNEPIFLLHYTTIKQRLRAYHNKITRTFLEDLDNVGLMSVKCKDNLYTIYFPKLLEIKDNHTRNLQVKTKPLAPREEKNRTDKNRVKNKVIVKKFDVEKIYQEYPKKQGKALGLKKLHATIKKQDDYDIVLQGAINYSKYVLENKVEARYIKQFSTWVNQESWNDEMIVVSSQVADPFKDLRNSGEFKNEI